MDLVWNWFLMSYHYSHRWCISWPSSEKFLPRRWWWTQRPTTGHSTENKSMRNVKPYIYFPSTSLKAQGSLWKMVGRRIKSRHSCDSKSAIFLQSLKYTIPSSIGFIFAEKSALIWMGSLQATWSFSFVIFTILPLFYTFSVQYAEWKGTFVVVSMSL